ncbi:MAG: hypothetical protein ACFCUX_09700 [Candidatus Methylacidiphilales bacterium]
MGKRKIAVPEWAKKNRRIATVVTIRIVLALIALLCLSLLFFRYFGLPERLGTTLESELKQRGLAVRFDRLYLDPLLRVVARSVVISHHAGSKVNHLTFDRLRFEFNWISWWRGEPLLETAAIRGGVMVLPLDETTAVELEAVEADFRLDENVLIVEKCSARILNVKVNLSGNVLLAGFEAPPADPPTEEEQAARAKLWRQILVLADQFSGSSPLELNVQFEITPADFKQSEVILGLDGSNQLFKGVLCEEIDLDIVYSEGMCRMGGRLRFLRGGVNLSGHWNPDSPRAEVSFDSDADFSLLAPAMPAPLDDFLLGVRFASLPLNQGRIRMRWDGSFSYHLFTRSQWKDFTVQGVPFHSLYFPLSYDGKRLMISKLEMENVTGRAELDLYYDGEKELKGRLVSTLVPTSLQRLFGPKAQPFFNSLNFAGKGPNLKCDITGSGLTPDLIQLKGNVKATDFSYKDVEMKEVTSSFTYGNQVIHLPDLKVVRSEGTGSGDVWHDIKNQVVKLKGVKSELDIRRVARVIGNKTEEYAQPYRFFVAPRATAEGVIDLLNPKKNQFKIHIISERGLEYDFLGKTMVLNGVDCDLNFKGETLEVAPRKPLGFFKGTLNGTLSLDLIEPTPYKAKLTIDQADFGAVMKTFFGNDDVSGQLTASAQLSGEIDHLSSMDGWGDITVVNGVLYSIPVFGTFSDVLNGLVPNLGYSKADKARSIFVINDGVIQMEKIDVYSTAFALIGSGSYDMVKDDVDISMRVNIRGILGVPLFLLSKLFEYQGTGTLSNTKWEPKSF